MFWAAVITFFLAIVVLGVYLGVRYDIGAPRQDAPVRRTAEKEKVVRVGALAEPQK